MENRRMADAAGDLRNESGPDAVDPGHTPRYHHGALRLALLDAADLLLERDGLEALSLRRIAATAGVSHAAPAHHFGDMAGLLSAVSARSFDGLAAEIRRRVSARPDAALQAAGEAYIAFALGRPEHFKLMFRRSRLDPADPALCEAGGAAYEELRSALRRHLGREPDPASLAAAWSTVHGYAHLVLEGQIPPLEAGGPDSAAVVAWALGSREQGDVGSR